jgi:hypothetical protein
MTKALDLSNVDRHPDTMITGLIPVLSCRNCRPHAPGCYRRLVVVFDDMGLFRPNRSVKKYLQNRLLSHRESRHN